MNGPSPETTADTQDEQRPKLSKPLAKAVGLLEDAAKLEKGNIEATFLLAEMNFYGNFSIPRNFKEAFKRYHKITGIANNSTAQHMVAFMYATGIGGAVEQNQAKALLYHTFAAIGGDIRSQMTVAFRHHDGIATPRHCDEAVYFYKKVADRAIQYYRSGPPGGMAVIKHAYRLADDEGGVYGEGASVSSAGANAVNKNPASDSHASIEDVLEYLDVLSRKGDLKATFSLGRTYYKGSRELRKNFKKARAYMMMVAKQQWTKDGRVIQNSGVDKLAATAAGYLGNMYHRGDGVEQSFEKALTWYRRGVDFGDARCGDALGIMYLYGNGVPKDVLKAAEYFKVSADQDHAPAQANMGRLLLDQGDVPTAQRYFELSARQGNIEAFYYLAELSNQGIGRDRSCGVAAAYYKIVAEKMEPIHSSFEQANVAYEDGDLETALVLYMMAAEQGYENAQANVAYLLDETRSRFSLDSVLPWKSTKSSLLKNSALALAYWTRSAKQKNMDSMVKMGDYYLSGIGTKQDPDKASACYHAASEYQHSAQALWNLGWMLENGIGVEQDFHLAKRLYDEALEVNKEAYLPVNLSLLKLRLRSWWNTITHGKVNSIHSEPGKYPFYCRLCHLLTIL
jgi:SEL1 protein